MKLSLSEFFMHFMSARGLYGRLASSLRRIAKPGLGTMAVGVRDGMAVLYYDPEFLALLDIPTAIFVLEHEMLHLVLDHIPRYMELLSVLPNKTEKAKAAAVYNIAMDAAINHMLRNQDGFAATEKLFAERALAKDPTHVPDPKDGLVLPEKFDLPLNSSFEVYQYLLMKKVTIVNIACKLHGGNTHEMWGSGDGESESKEGGAGKGLSHGQYADGINNDGKRGGGAGDIDITFEGGAASNMSSEELISQANRIREQVKKSLRDAVKSMGGVGRGTVPGDVAEWLAAFLAEPVLNWWEIFSTRARMSRLSKYERNVATPNRALLALSEEDPSIIPNPGRIRDRSWRIFLMVDTSGSMSSESLEVIKSELQHMLAVDENTEIRYMEGDSAVHVDVVLKQGDEIPKEVVGRGGTCFNAYFEYMRQYVKTDDKAPDLVVCYTDGFAPAVEMSNRLPQEIPVLWLVTPQHSSNFAEGYGEVIVCDPSHNESYKNR